MKENVKGRACSQYGRDKKCITNICRRNQKERDQLKDLDFVGRTTLKQILMKSGRQCVD
jgi:hypothetical protein